MLEQLIYMKPTIIFGVGVLGVTALFDTWRRDVPLIIVFLGFSLSILELFLLAFTGYPVIIYSVIYSLLLVLPVITMSLVLVWKKLLGLVDVLFILETSILFPYIDSFLGFPLPAEYFIIFAGVLTYLPLYYIVFRNRIGDSHPFSFILFLGSLIYLVFSVYSTIWLNYTCF